MPDDRVPCPDCREPIVRGAKVCRFCGRGRVGPTTHAFVVRQVLGLGFLVLVLLFCLIPIFVPRFLTRDEPAKAAPPVESVETKAFLERQRQRIREADERERERRRGE